MLGNGRVVVLASGAGTTLAALLAAHEQPGYPARIVGVISDQPTAAALDRARDAGVATAVVALADFDDRDAWNVAVAAAIDVFNPDLVVLAGFMRVLGSPFVERWAGRSINTHPSLLPAFPGAHGVRDALAHGVKVTGCTVHLVDAGLDTGPILSQVAVSVEPDDDEATLHERIKTVERDLLVDTVARMVTGGVAIDVVNSRRATLR
ncbi:MAG: phosphoribosylglycinamide formyltransferase [Micrococcales bacterium]|nr:phosphoribosylglycinamide formyltransferase [Micrococcales bacterium]MCL2668296.1 phosphoribosylglycinamide formyltransferase [Micrococcales bacterium]